jgi:hypothetical protein
VTFEIISSIYLNDFISKGVAIVFAMSTALHRIMIKAIDSYGRKDKSQFPWSRINGRLTLFLLITLIMGFDILINVKMVAHD